jgi:baculoviral IAP repeat-containing protein 6
VRYDEERPQFMRACLTGVEGTPYSNGVFMFDIYCPPDYPNVNCNCIHVTPGAHMVHANNGPGGFSPNLHNDSGKVCLSLLGTWDGPGWEAGKSNVYQVLSSIMWMILGAEHPYYMEPGYGGWEGTIDESSNQDEVLWYDEEVKWGTAQVAILDQLRNPPRGFEKVVRKHLLLKRKIIMATLRAWHDKGTENLKTRLAPVIAELEEEFTKHLDVESARADVREREQEVEFIRNKMDFLEKKLKACVGDPQTVMPKAYQRFKIGPALLKQALDKLQKAQQILADAEVRELQNRTDSS